MKFYKSNQYSEGAIASLRQYLVETYAPIVLFVNSDLDVLYTNGEVGQFLSFPKALAQFNIKKMLAREGAIIFKNCVDKTLEGSMPILYKDYELSQKKSAKYADFYFQKFNIFNLQEPIVMVRVLLHNEPTTVKNFPGVESESNINEELNRLEKKINNSEKTRQVMINELEATNEELQTSNRELLASNEELISTNEELQSVNEELHTVNSELQIKNEELSTTKNDINNMLKSTDIGILFLDSQYHISRFNESVKLHYNLQDSDLGRSISDFRGNFEEINLAKIAREVYRSLEPYEKEVVDKEGVYYLLRVLPYRTDKDQIKGVIVTFLDVNDLSKARAKQAAVAAKFKAVFNTSQNVIISLYEDGVIRNINRSLLGYEKEELIGSQLSNLFPFAEKDKLLNAIQIVQESEFVHTTSFTLINSRNGEKCYFDATFISSLSEMESEQQNKFANTLVFLKDKTKSIKQQVDLENTLNMYYAFMQNTQHQIILVNKSMEVLYINHWFDQRIRHAKKLSKHIRNYLPETAVEPYVSYVESILQGNSTQQKLSLVVEDDKGEKHTVKYIGIPIATPEGINHVATIANYVLD